MQRCLLDTHVVIDVAIAGGIEAMPARVQSVLRNPDVELLLSVASEMEVAIKSRLGKIELRMEELDLVCANASIRSYPLQKRHADQMFRLPLHHKDPFDRMIIATALSDEIPVISRDERFQNYEGLRLIW